MSKSSRSSSPPDFVFVRDVLPHLEKLIEAELRRIGQRKLAAQVPEMRIYGRCPCRAPSCGTFYCVPPAEYERLAPFGAEIGEVTVAKGKIIRVETCESTVDAVLDRLFPDSQGNCEDAG